MSTNPMVAAIDAEVARVQADLSRLQKARKALDGYTGGSASSGGVTVSVSPSRGRKPTAKATTPKATKTGRKPRITSEKAQEIVATKLAAAGPEGLTTREIEAQAPEMNYAGIRRALDALGELSAVSQVGEGKRNARYAFIGDLEALKVEEPEEGPEEGEPQEGEPQEGEPEPEAETVTDPSLDGDESPDLMTKTQEEQEQEKEEEVTVAFD